MSELKPEMKLPPSASALTRKLGKLALMSEDEAQYLESLQSNIMTVAPDRDFVRDGEDFKTTFIVKSGWAIRYVGLSDGRRQILSYALPGDILGLHINFRATASYSAAALTECELAAVEPARMIEISQRFPLLAAGLSWCTAREFAILGDQALRLGRLTAYERVCHLILELWYRLSLLGEVEDDWIEFPLNQTVIADTLGLSLVHVNRQLMRLRKEGLIQTRQRRLQILDFEELCSVSEFDDSHMQGFIE